MPNQALELARVTIPDNVWHQDAQRLNAHIKRLIEGHNPRDEGAPPNPSEEGAFTHWLASKPRSWSVVIAARAALRLLPVNQATGDLLEIFRAAAISRFVVLHQTGEAIKAAGEVAAPSVSTAAFVAAFYAASAGAVQASTIYSAGAVAAALRTSEDRHDVGAAILWDAQAHCMRAP
jgi:hypothetical protein